MVVVSGEGSVKGKCDVVKREVEKEIFQPGFYAILYGMKRTERLKKTILNKHLLPVGFAVEGKYQLPKVMSYKGELPEEFIPYNFGVTKGCDRKGVYCNIADSGINSTWSRPLNALQKVSRYKVAVGPDHTLWVDGLICENVEQLRKNRTTTLFWQSNGCPTIPCASWGDANSIDNYAFDGLPEDSWIAIGHQRVGNLSEQRLYRYAVRKLIERKNPIGLVVFGSKFDYNPGVQVRYYPSFISKLRRL